MVSVFDVERLRGFLRDFYRITRIRTTVFDENGRELVSWPEHVAPYCAVIRETEKGREACMRCDREACRAAAQRHGTHIYLCHAGLTEAAVPLYAGEIVAGYLLFGHGFSYADHETGWAEIGRRCAALPVNREKLREAVMGAEIIGEEYVRAAAHILRAVAACLIREKLAAPDENMLPVRLDAYLSAHFVEKISSPLLCKALDIGKTRLYQLSAQLYGCGIAERVRQLRIARAKELLASGREMSVSEIAALCGYPDSNYFAVSFRRETGLSPTGWRKRHRG